MDFIKLKPKLSLMDNFLYFGELYYDSNDSNESEEGR